MHLNLPPNPIQLTYASTAAGNASPTIAISTPANVFYEPLSNAATWNVILKSGRDFVERQTITGNN